MLVVLFTCVYTVVRLVYVDLTCWDLLCVDLLCY